LVTCTYKLFMIDMMIKITPHLKVSLLEWSIMLSEASFTLLEVSFVIFILQATGDG